LSMLIVNCGSGVDTHFYCTEGAGRIYVTDLSERTVKLAENHNPRVRGATAATERLPFRDGAFDFVGVRSGLHHLDDPFEGLREMARVARHGVFFVEGQKTALVPLLVTLGFLEAEEESGNVVYRFTRDEVRVRLTQMGFQRVDCFTGWYLQFPWLMRLSKNVSGRLPAHTLRLAVYLINLVAGRWGNAMIVAGSK
jgi:ubiquinone/menaquinone biosynthesis C-methylase UbiE